MVAQSGQRRAALAAANVRHHGLEGVSGLRGIRHGTEAGKSEAGRSEEAITQHPAPPGPVRRLKRIRSVYSPSESHAKLVSA